jgi:hypothetical protein
VHSLEHSASLIPFFLLSNLDVIGPEEQNADDKKEKQEREVAIDWHG